MAAWERQHHGVQQQEEKAEEEDGGEGSGPIPPEAALKLCESVLNAFVTVNVVFTG